MNCNDFYIHFDDYCDGELEAGLAASCDAHRQSCLKCAQAVVDHENMMAMLKALPVVGPSEGFADRALRLAVEKNVDHHHRHGFVVGFGSAAVAALALWVVVGVLPQKLPDNAGNAEIALNEQIPEFSIALNKQSHIKLAFHSAEALTGARITIQLPENVALVGFPGQRELAWQTNLAKGDNLLSLPVVANSTAKGQMVAHIEYMGKIKTLKVNLAVNPAALSRFAPVSDTLG